MTTSEVIGRSPAAERLQQVMVIAGLRHMTEDAAEAELQRIENLSFDGALDELSRWDAQAQQSGGVADAAMCGLILAKIDQYEVFTAVRASKVHQ